MVVLTMLCRKGAGPSKNFSRNFSGLLAGTISPLARSSTATTVTTYPAGVVSFHWCLL